MEDLLSGYDFMTAFLSHTLVLAGFALLLFTWRRGSILSNSFTRTFTCIVCFTGAPFGSSALAQIAVTNVIPIEPYFETWDYATAGGKGRACGYYLYGRFPAYSDYTATGDYKVEAFDSAGRPVTPEWSETSPGPGENFVFGVSGSWTVGPAQSVKCPTPYAVASKWTATLVVPPPTVSFAFNDAPGVPGRIKFVSFSRDPLRKRLDFQWKFGDGTEDTFPAPSHDYAKPGEYQVVLRATNPAGAFNTRTNTVVVNPPRLRVSLDFVDRKDSRPALGETVKVRATVRASREGLGALSNVQFTGSPVLGIPEVFELVTAPESTGIGDLQPGDSRVFDWTLKVVNAGKFTLRTADLTGKDAAQRAVVGEVGELPGNVSGLLVDIVFPGKPVELKKKPQQAGELSNMPGYEPASFPVKVRVSVPAKGKPVESLTLQGWELSDSGLDIDQVRATGVAEQPWQSVVPQPLPFPLTVTNKPPAATLGKVLAPGDPPAEFDFIVRAERPGSFEFASLFTAKQVGADTVLQERGSGIRSVLGDLVLAVQVEIVNQPAEIKEGEAVEVFGLVKNLTDNETILLDPIHIINSGQGVVLGPVEQKAVLPEIGSLGIFAPVLTPAGDTKEARFRARVKTARIPGLDQNIMVARTSVVLDFAVGGLVLGQDGAERELAPENMVVEFGNGSHTAEGATFLRVPVQPDPIKPLELSAEQFLYRLYGNTVERLAGGSWEAITGVAQFIKSAPGLVWSLASFTQSTKEEVGRAYLNTARYLWTYADWVVAVNRGISPETRRAELDALAAELQAYYGRKAPSPEKMKALVDGSVEGFFANVMKNSQAAFDHDYEFNAETADVLTAWVRPATKFVVEEAVTDLATGLFLTRIARSAKVADDLAKAAERQALNDADAVETAVQAVVKRADPESPSLLGAPADLRNLRGGAKADAFHALRGWVVDKVTDANLIKLTDWKNGGLPIVVAVRSRADETIEWMRTKLGMTPKPVTMKPKNVDEIDVEFLGYRRGSSYGDKLGRGGGDRGSVVLAEPLPPDVVRARIAALPEPLRYEVASRYHTRWKEWYGKKSVPLKPEPPDDPLPWDQIMPSDTTVHPDSYVWELKYDRARRVQVGDGVDVRDGRVGTLPVPKRGSVPDPSINSDVSEIYAGASFEERKLELRQVIDPPEGGHFNGRVREYYEVWLEDEVGALRRVAGDIDTVLVADLSGFKLGLNPLKKGIKEYGNKVARLLQHLMKAQHPWSSSLIPDGMRAEYLDAHRWHPDPNKRGEPLLIYFNGERRIGWFRPDRNVDVIDPDNPLESLMFLDGGPGSVDDVVRTQWADRNRLAVPEEQVPKVINTAANAVRKSLIENDYLNKTTLLATCAVGASRATGATLYRLSQAEELEKRNPDGTWSKTFPEAECGPNGIVIVPETVIREDVVAGALRIPIVEELLGPDWRDLFRIGDDVLIAPGTPEEEQNTITGYGSLVLARPLSFNHPAGTQVALLPPTPAVALAVAQQPLIWLTAESGLELRGTNVITWKDQAGGVDFVNPEGGRDGLPALVDSGLGLPALRFKGDEWIAGGVIKSLTHATIFTLSRFNTATSSGRDYIYSIGSPGAAGSMMTLGRRTGDSYHFDGKTIYAPAGSSLPGNVWQVFTQVYGEGNPASHQLFLNGERIVDTLAAAPYNVDGSQIFLGNYESGSFFFTGDLVEWILFDRVLEPAERSAFETYLARRGGIYQPSAALTISIRPSKLAAHQVTLVWESEQGQEYQLEHSLNLAPGSWTVDRTFTAQTSGPTEVEITEIQTGASVVFYRLRRN